LLEETARLRLEHFAVCDDVIEQLSPGVLENDDDISGR
jgi:hypothetical protein